jgi:hypothetical protein
MTKKKKRWDKPEFWDAMWNQLMDDKQKDLVERYLDDIPDKEMNKWYNTYLEMLDDHIGDSEEYVEEIVTRKQARDLVQEISSQYGGPYPRRLIVKRLCKKYPKFKTWRGL